MFPFGGTEVGVIWCGRFHIVEDSVGPTLILSAKVCGPHPYLFIFYYGTCGVHKFWLLPTILTLLFSFIYLFF